MNLAAGFPFGKAGGTMMDIGFVVGAGIIAGMSVVTLLEQR
jgi:hypothetical protein